MKIISHRGLWHDDKEKNSMEAFQNSFKNQFGIETDVRDYKGELVIAHDLPDEKSPKLSDFFKLYKEFDDNLILALNIKSDGLQKKLLELLKKYKISSYYVFDMSIPDSIAYKNFGFKFLSRRSEHEPDPSFYIDCDGIWLDCFNDIWYSESVLMEYLADNKKVFVVSPELHKRDKMSLWKNLKNWNVVNNDNLILCTDLPEAANTFFK